ncbi:hypothetical protein SPIRO4BDMA_50174 [uncultured spirochete]|uniref:Uncharacterized protein n=1 Tax=uncultured spirochete TaxID=156406 RepID=A0A3P3XRH1_9SPIR|nr:hypothetical protein SPIRO4BDMA_50174 [uncultured spirochete]
MCADSDEANEKEKDNKESYLLSSPQLPDMVEEIALYCIPFVHFGILPVLDPRADP